MHTSQTKKTLSIFWKHAMKYRGRAAFILGSLILVTGLQTYTTTIYRDLINMLTEGKVINDLAPAFWLIVLIFSINMFRQLLWRVTNFVNNYFQPKVMADLTNTCYQYLQKHSYGFFTSKFVGSLVTKVKRYERSFEVIADQITFDLGQSIVVTVFIIAILLWQYPVFGIMILVWSIAFFIFCYYFAKYKLPYDIERAESDTYATGQLADSITNNVNIKAFSSYGLENKRFDTVTDRQFRSRQKSWNLGTIGELVQGVSMVCLELLIMYVALRYWQKGLLNVGDIALLQLYYLRVVDKLWSTGKNIRNIYEAIADANEMTEMLSKPHGIQDLPSAPLLSASKGGIEFKDVTFSYHRKKQPIFTGFNFAIKPGERVALVGPSGGGKSTILKLLLRFHDIDSGSISIDSQNIASVTQDSLRNAISLVPQDPILFHRTIADNIRYAKPEATDEEVISVAKLAHAHEFIERMPLGYKSLVGERGIKLSGGERQRVAIARAILKAAPILILDEATSSLDSESEMFIQDALKTLMKSCTTIVVAHRLSTIMQMDRIVVISGGKIIEEGEHDELLKARSGTYQKLWNIQAGGFSSA